MKLKPQKGAWILGVLFLMGIVFPTFSPKEVQALAEQGDTITFSYNPTTIHQEVSVDTVGKNELTATVRVAEAGYGVDTILVGIALYGPGGGGIYFHDTGWVPISPGGYGDISLSVNAQSVGSGWGGVSSARITIGGDDGEFWAGNYGPSVESASLKLDGTELLSNTDFASGSEGWTSSVGWQTCHATQGGQPCSSIASRLNNSPYTLGTNMVWGIANEGWNLTLSAPGGRNI